jgi:beta-galactosidase
MMKALLLSFLLFSVILISCNRQKKFDRNFISEDDAYWFERTDAEDLSANNWHLWLDTTRSWRYDSLWLKPDISKLPVNPPSCGWEELDNGIGRNIKLPATVEEHFWGQNGNNYGVTGDYTGVSWYSTHFSVSDKSDKKRVILHFESARMRAEVYVNRKLAGYNLVDGTPFEVDASAFVKEGKNALDVRITDPNGEFTWCDFPYLPWGKYLTSPSHGFGGITGRVRLFITDKSYIKDVFVKNKPSITDIEAEVSLNREEQKAGTVYFTITPWGSRDIIAQDQLTLTEDSARSVIRKTFSVPNAEQWSVNSPALYQLNVVWKGTDGSTDAFSRRFGFRWFEVRNVNGDKQFFLNNRRIVLRTAISWGFWPVNGIYPTREMAIKQINTAKKLGLNMLNFHRAIGQSMVLDLADELGLLYYEEPGGYRESDNEFAQKWSREKLLRMVKRDRSHPSLVIYNMANESVRDPSPQAKVDIADAHRLDETRVITYTSTYFPAELHPYGGKCPKTPAPIKLYMLPYNRELLYQGWWDEHHAGGPGSYYDDAYNGPDDFYLNSNNKGEIIYYGEEGAIGTPGRLELIKNSLEQQDGKGWDGQDYQQLFETYDRFISERGFRKAFPNVDNLTRGMGNVAYYYQGRAIENFRINNINDGYAINGWEENKLENHSGIVDSYRNPKGDVNLIADYNQPLFLAVKARNKVFETNNKTRVDIYIVNEVDINGDYELEVTASDSREEFFKNTYPVKVSGGNTFGELLVKGIEITPTQQGHCDIHAKLIRSGELITEGSDQLYTVIPNKEDINMPFSLMDTSGTLGEYFKSIGIVPPITYKDGKPATDIVVVGAANPPENYPIRHDLFEWVAEGHTLVIAGNADKWAQAMGRREIVDYRGSRLLGKYWYGGNYFVKENPLFAGLPVNCVFNWEYQCFAQYKRERIGLRLSGDDVVVGAASDHKQELYSAVSIIPMGKGKIILSALDILGAIKEGKPSSVIAKKLLLNYLIYAQKNNR